MDNDSLGEIIEGEDEGYAKARPIDVSPSSCKDPSPSINSKGGVRGQIGASGSSQRMKENPKIRNEWCVERELRKRITEEIRPTLVR